MISSKKDLKEYLSYEESVYFNEVNGSKLHAWLVCSKFYRIWKYIRTLRYSEYYKNCGNKIMFAYMHRKKHYLGNRLGFEIPENCVGKGITIYHISPIIINEDVRIGENFKISGNFCAGNQTPGSGCPVIGNNVLAGWGSTVIGDIKIADAVVLGAGCVLISSVDTVGASVAGVPAKIIK